MKRTRKRLAALLLACALVVRLPAPVSAAAPGPKPGDGQNVSGPLGDGQPGNGGETGGDGGRQSGTLSGFAGSDEELADLATANVVIDLFQVASAEMSLANNCTYTMNESGWYNTLAGDLEAIVNDGIPDPEKSLQEMARKAARLTVGEADGKLAYKGEPYLEGAPTRTRNPGDEADKISGIEPGLYLVFARGARTDVGEHPFLYEDGGDIVTRVRTKEYVYTYQPLLVFVPGTDDNGSWVYNVTLHLKPSRSAGRVGDLEITKTVRDFHADHDGVFVFRVDVYIDGVLDPRYGGIYTMTFNENGSRTVTLTGIPEDAAVVVTEVYSGAAYRLDSSTPASQQGVISFDEVMKAEFVNVGSTGSGGAVRNHFTWNGDTWDWAPIPMHE